MVQYCLVPTEWGPFTLITVRGRVATTRLPGPSAAACEAPVHRDYPDAEYRCRLLVDLQRAIQYYFQGRRTVFRATLALSGLTPFQRAVVQACRRIRYGQRVTYGELAERAGHSRAARAVGSVMARNRFPLIVPCHRVVACTGVGGFSSDEGVSQKIKLLRLEGTIAAPADRERRRVSKRVLPLVPGS